MTFQRGASVVLLLATAGLGAAEMQARSWLVRLRPAMRGRSARRAH